MSDIPAGSSVGRLPGRRYATGRCLQERGEVKEFILSGPAARDCGIGGVLCSRALFAPGTNSESDSRSTARRPRPETSHPSNGPGALGYFRRDRSPSVCRQKNEQKDVSDINRFVHFKDSVGASGDAKMSTRMGGCRRVRTVFLRNKLRRRGASAFLFAVNK